MNVHVRGGSHRKNRDKRNAVSDTSWRVIKFCLEDENMKIKISDIKVFPDALL